MFTQLVSSYGSLSDVLGHLHANVYWESPIPEMLHQKLRIWGPRLVPVPLEMLRGKQTCK